MFVDVDAYDLKGSPTTWSKVLALRHAMSKFPECRYMWYLDQDAYIMEPSISLEEHLMNAARLEELMLRDQSVVPPDSIIKTFTHLKGRDVDLVLTQDREGLSVGSFVVRNGEWAQYLLESWFDPLYRSYNFQKAENHALVSRSLGGIDWKQADVMDRNTLCSGTRRFCPSWPSCLRTSSTLTTRQRRESRCSRRATLW